MTAREKRIEKPKRPDQQDLRVFLYEDLLDQDDIEEIAQPEEQISPWKEPSVKIGGNLLFHEFAHGIVFEGVTAVGQADLWMTQAINGLRDDVEAIHGESREAFNSLAKAISEITDELAKLREFLALIWKDVGRHSHQIEAIEGLVDIKEDYLRNLVKTWLRRALFTSAGSGGLGLTSFENVKQQGDDIVPFLLEELKSSPSEDLLNALKEVTGENPVKEHHKGDLRKSAEDWFGWTKAR